MLNRYRLPLFLLGIGIGIILTNTIYTFNPNIKYKDYSEEEIIAEATDLGMVFIKDNIDVSSKKEECSEISINDIKKEGQKKEIQFTVEDGDSLEKVSKGLYESGIIDDAEKFHKFAKDKKVDKKLRVGTYMFSFNFDYETIINILTKSTQ